MEMHVSNLVLYVNKYKSFLSRDIQIAYVLADLDNAWMIVTNIIDGKLISFMLYKICYSFHLSVKKEFLI